MYNKRRSLLYNKVVTFSVRIQFAQGSLRFLSCESFSTVIENPPGGVLFLSHPIRSQSFSHLTCVPRGSRLLIFATSSLEIA
jgi:hypothetical protein